MVEDIANYWIKHLQLMPHPEGGYYKEVFRSAVQVNRSSSKKSAACTSIYYLLEGADFSGFHRLASDEIWYFHKGMPLHIYVLSADGKMNVIELSDMPTGQLSIVIPANTWFAAELPGKTGFTLASCAVAPGFEFAEFEMADRGEMIKTFPEREEVLGRLCR